MLPRHRRISKETFESAPPLPDAFNVEVFQDLFLGVVTLAEDAVVTHKLNGVEEECTLRAGRKVVLVDASREALVVVSAKVLLPGGSQHELVCGTPLRLAKATN